MRIILDINKFDKTYRDGVDAVHALYDAGRKYVIWYCVKHRKKIPSDKRIAKLIFYMPYWTKEHFYIIYKIHKTQFQIKQLIQ